VLKILLQESTHIVALLANKFLKMLNVIQKKIVSWAIVCVAIVVLVLFTLSIFMMLGRFLSFFSVVFTPLAVSAIIAIIFKPIIDFLVNVFKFKPIYAVLTFFIFLTGAISLILIFALPPAFMQLRELIKSIPDAIHTLSAHLFERFPDLKQEISRQIQNFRESDLEGEWIRKIFGNWKVYVLAFFGATSKIVGIASTIAAFAVVPIYLFYMLSSKPDFSKYFENNTKWLKKNIRDDIKFLVGQFADILTAFFRGQILIGVIMGLLYGIGFSFVGIKFGFIIGFITGILNIVPYFGTIIGLSVILPLSFFQYDGGLTLTILAASIFTAVQLIESYALTPIIMGDRTGLHPTAIIFSVFFWGVAFNGILGMILAIPLTAFFVVLWRLLNERYLPILISQKND